MLSQKRAKAELYTQYPLSSLLIYNGATILHFLPDYQGQGLAIELMKEFVTNLKKAGVERIYTLVNWNDWDLLRFFEKSGFVPAKMLNLELQIT